MFPSMPVSPELREAASDLAGRSGRVASICTGTFILAASGLLDGRRATTHWQHTATLARAYPQITVVPDAIFIQDGTVFSSAGVTAGIDLALALLERDHGAEMARRVAQLLVVFLQRPGGQSQFSPSLSGPRPRVPALRAVVEAVAADPAGEYSVDELAALAHLSPRHLTRLFREELGTTPAKYVELIRFDSAKALLDAGHSVTEAAQLAGFGSSESLRRAFSTHLGISPQVYRRRFSSFRLRLTFVLALRRAHALLVEPGKAVVRDLTPAVVDGQRVTSIAEDLVFVDRRGLGVLLERAVRTGFRDCAILAAADHQEWPRGER